VVYETPLVASSRRLSVVHGTGARSPADHWLVDCVHTPETGFCTNVSGVLGCGAELASVLPAPR
jgi:hypothetical protein